MGITLIVDIFSWNLFNVAGAISKTPKKRYFQVSIEWRKHATNVTGGPLCSKGNYDPEPF